VKKVARKIEEKMGLYNPEYEHDACGIGFVADIKGRKSRKIIDMALECQANLDHRGAVGADPETGDGAGILIQMPDAFFRRVCSEEGIELPEYGKYAVGFIFLPKDPIVRKAAENIVEKIIIDEGQNFLGWRDVPTDDKIPGKGAKMLLPFIRQCFLSANEDIKDQLEFEKKLYLIRRVIDRRIRLELKLPRKKYSVPSFSSRVIVYKGMLLAEQLPKFYKDLNAQDMESALGMVHTRFSTNTFPSWELAHPYRYIVHNGEINTVRGNKNWMAARQAIMESSYFGLDLKRMLPIVMEGQSDSATFDSVFELLVMGGRSLPHAMMMMIPEAWSKNDLMDPQLRSFYEYHASLMEPWDGPAAIAFTDGNVIGATLDRNGLRPARYVVTKDDLIILASEEGTIHIEPDKIEKQGRLQPGKMFVVDLIQKRIIEDEEIKKQISSQKPYQTWVEKNMIKMKSLPEPDFFHKTDHETIFKRQKIFGYTKEDLFMILRPMAVDGQEPIGSMGVDAALAVLSEKPQLLYRYFKQLFAQVTNPPIDAIREELVMELTSYIGSEQNLLDETPLHAHRIELEHPVLSNIELEQLRNITAGQYKALTIPILFNPNIKRDMRNQLDKICVLAAKSVKEDVSLIILSDRGVSLEQAPIPALLATSAVHHHLIREGLRTKTGIIIESGEPREVVHMSLLCGYGANAINPYLVYETMEDLHSNGFLPEIEHYNDILINYKKAIQKGLFKIFSKMGISTLQSYCGAQIFETVGLDKEVVETYFTGTSTQIEGLSLEMIEEETVKRYKDAFNIFRIQNVLSDGGLYHYRVNGEKHFFSPIIIAKLQESCQKNDYKLYKEYSSLIKDRENSLITLRGLFLIDTLGKSISIEEVEPASEIVKRFSTGAMSFGSISWEAHTNLAIAMNRIGGKSNTGEGGEDPVRFKNLANGDSMRSSIKQVASGRFGVTASYLINADELQIKIAQGAKPGEGGQLPGIKVDKIIAKTRYSTPGVTLISPPPHHDIYSIEDLKQLIFDLKNINPNARISVKLVSETGVGTIAAGVSKALADHILISGHDGGTGASPISSIHYAGTPWELGLAETHQVLISNGLRDRTCLAVDGKLLNGRDVVIGALLGADEFGFATVPLITQGCIMMRKCHLNTCPVGVATQKPELRKKFMGKPEYLVNFMYFVAEEVREFMAQLGYKTFNEMIGQTQRLNIKRPKNHWKARGIDMTKILHKPKPLFDTGTYHMKNQDHGLKQQLDNELIKLSKAALEKKKKVKIEIPVRNIHRTVGAMLSGEAAKRYGDEGLPEDTIEINMNGVAGQSFGCFLYRGITLSLTGAANDYCGKGLSGGKLIVKVPDNVSFDPAKNIIIGNTCFYGATGGEAYINGMAGERFCVRNSGVRAVVEGVGDHGCEYMTGGRVVVLGSVGRNFAAGMSGGIAYVWDTYNLLSNNLNQEMIEIESLTEADDIDMVIHMISRHKDYTNSRLASFILSNWEEESKKFVKIIPGEYKIALLKMEEELAAKAEIS